MVAFEMWQSNRTLTDPPLPFDGVDYHFFLLFARTHPASPAISGSPAPARGRTRFPSGMPPHKRAPPGPAPPAPGILGRTLPLANHFQSPARPNKPRIGSLPGKRHARRAFLANQFEDDLAAAILPRP